MADTPIWCVMEYDGGGVQIEPKSWTETGSSATSYWPKRGVFNSDLQYHNAVKHNTSPEITWPDCKTSTLGFNDDFEDAKRKLKKSEVNADHNTDVEKEKKAEKSGRKKKHLLVLVTILNLKLRPLLK